MWTRLGTRFDEHAPKRWLRTTCAIAFACLQLLFFVAAGHARLGLPFDAHPGEPPQFTDIHAPATRGFPRQPTDWNRLVVSRWDAQHYIGTAVRGLSACPTDPVAAKDGAYLDCGLGWLPAYGAVGGVISDVTGFGADTSLLLLSFLCAVIVNLVWTHRAIMDRIGKREAYLALVAFNAFPTAFYMVTPYTEAATLALVLGAYVMLAADRWVLAGLLVGAATALRISAVAFCAALGCAALLAAWQRRTAKTARWWLPLVAIPLSGWGQLAEMLAIKASVGDAGAFWRARHAFGDKQDPGRLLEPTWFLKGVGAQHMDLVLYGAVVGVFAMTARELVRRFKPIEATYLGVATLLSMVLVVLAPQQYWGINRYLLLCPLAFVGLGLIARKHVLLFVCWLVFCLAFMWHVELCSYVTQGNPELCPCLGRFEFAMPVQS